MMNVLAMLMTVVSIWSCTNPVVYTEKCRLSSPFTEQTIEWRTEYHLNGAVDTITVKEP